MIYPLGLAAVKFWNRKKFKGCRALKKKINPTRVPIEEKESARWLENLRQSTALFDSPKRCVHVGDRESDIYELYCLAQDLGTNFLVRTCVNRLAGDGCYTIEDAMNTAKIKGLHKFNLHQKDGKIEEVVLEIKFMEMCVKPPIGKQRDYCDHNLTVIYATERGTPSHREKICWKLLTNLPVKSKADAIEKLKWYATRWQIETFHKILKSGCRAEDSKLRNAERLVNLLSIFCILSWRQFWMTMINRSDNKINPRLALTQKEINILDGLISDKKITEKKTLTDYLTKIAQLGGYLARAKDPPPGNIVMWRGLARLTDIQTGIELAKGLVGN